ncbi:MAG: tankyrase-2 isoform [Verrucomicrobiales bacterium]|nr:tankyrase-2 isoform [Verrucomicrobiales bacterium]
MTQKFTWKKHRIVLIASLRLCVEIFLLTITACSFAHAATTNDITSLVQRGLFEEEANHNLDAAMQSYETAIKLHDKDRKLAATAIFRLGECYRKQGKTNEANAYYKRIITEFADQPQLVELSRSYVGNIADTNSDAFAERARKNFRGNTSDSKAAQQDSGNEILVASLRSVQLETAQAEAQWKHVSQLAGDELVNFFTTIQPDQLVIDLDRERRDAESKLQVLATQFGEQHPEYKAQDKVVQTTAKRLQQRAHTVAWGVEQKYKMLKEQEGALKKQLDADRGDQLASNAKKSLTATTSEEDEDIRKIKDMIQNSPDLINVAVNSDDGTPLQKACIHGHLKVAEFLLANGANINVRTEKVSPPLICAAVHGHKALVDLLLSKGADIETQSTVTYHYQTALMCAAFRGFKTITQTLLEHGAKVNATDDTGRTAVHRAAENGYPEIAELLLTNKARVDATTLEKKTPLHLACDANRVDVVKVLVDHGADVNAKSDGGFTPLLNASEHGQLDVASFLLEHGANIDDAVSNNWTQAEFRGFRPINFAISRNDVKLLKLLLEHHANPNSTFTRENVNAFPRSTTHGLTPLLTTLNRELVEMLLNHGADPNLADENGKTPLHLAVESREKALVELLIAHGAKVNATNKQGTPPIAYVRGATTGVPSEIRQLLVKAGANENFVRLKQISIRRNGQDNVIFSKGSNDWNHYTLLELISVVYGNNRPPSSDGGNPELALRLIPNRGVRGIDSSGFIPPPPLSISSGVPAPAFQFPDVAHIKVKRISKLPFTTVGNHDRVGAASRNYDNEAINASSKPEAEHTENVKVLLEAGLPSNDLQLEWGDIVEIPEQDHPINSAWQGLSGETQRQLMLMLRREVQIKIKGGFTNLTILPPMVNYGSLSAMRANYQHFFNSTMPKVSMPENYIVSPFGLREVVDAAGILRSSSDTTHVKILRNQDENTRSITVNLAEGEEPWIEPGDTIEIPDRDPAAAASGAQKP